MLVNSGVSAFMNLKRESILWDHTFMTSTRRGGVVKS